MCPRSKKNTAASTETPASTETQGMRESAAQAANKATDATDATIAQPRLGFVGGLRFAWRRLVSMPTALMLLLLLALAAIPGSLVPQRSSDPNGVTQYFANNPDLAPVLDKLQLFDVYSSVWFSAIYILLFVSLIGCVIPRVSQHAKALRGRPPRTPSRLERLPASVTWHTTREPDEVITVARATLKKARYRIEDDNRAGRLSLSAERGYARETGNLIFHVALIGVLAAVAIGSTVTYFGQKVLVVGQTFANTLAAYDSFNPGTNFNSEASLSPFALTLDSFDVTYELENVNSLGRVRDYTANVTVTKNGETTASTIKVNDPLNIDGADVYLMGNGYAPVVTVRNAAGDVVFSDPVPFLPQDTNLTSLGVIKVPDTGTDTQIGMIGFFYPTQAVLGSGAFTSVFPGPVNPVLTLNVYTGNLGLDNGVSTSVYTLNTDNLAQVAGGHSGVEALKVAPGQSVDLPKGLGTVTLDSVPRYISIEVRKDPTQVWVLVFALLAVGGLLLSLFVPRRRVWVAVEDAEPVDGVPRSRVTVAALARGDDPTLPAAVAAIAATLGHDAGGGAQPKPSKKRDGRTRRA